MMSDQTADQGTNARAADKATDKLAVAIATYQAFLDPQQTGLQSLMLATVGTDGRPNASYAPFIRDEAYRFYIYVSGLSTHTQNLHANPQTSILLMEDEAQARQIFARTRLSYDCTAQLIDREEPSWAGLVDGFAARFGPVVEMLRELPDFRIFQLTPVSGRFVMGFGAAYEVDVSDPSRLIHVTQ